MTLVAEHLSIGSKHVILSPGKEKIKVSCTDTKMRINEQISIIIRRHSAAVVEVYRHGVLIWKTGAPHSVQQESLTTTQPLTIHLIS